MAQINSFRDLIVFQKAYIPRLGENAKHLRLEAVNPELFSPKVIASLSGRTILTEGKIVPSRMAKVYSQLAQRSHAHRE